MQTLDHADVRSRCRPLLVLCTLVAGLSWLGVAAEGSSSADIGRAARPGEEMSAGRHRESRPLSPEAVAGYEGRIGPLEQRLFDDAADGCWHQHTLLAASLIASGVHDPVALARHQQRFAALVAELRRSGRVAGSPVQQAQAVFEFMHRRILTGGYHLEATDLALPLDQGQFNCVSASVLFNCLAGEFGLTTRGLEIPGHAMSRLVLGERSLDLETTCPTWFRILHDPRKQADHAEQVLGIHADPPRTADDAAKPGRADVAASARGMTLPPLPATRREVSEVELVATIYYNRGVDLLAQKRFADALAANAKALRLDSSNLTARGNLLATINNWAIELGSQGRYSDAAGLLTQGMALDPSYNTFKANFVHVYYQWAEDFCRQDRYEDGVHLLAAALEVLPDESYFRQARLDVYRRWARTRFQSGQEDEAYRVLGEARELYGDLVPARP